MDKSDPLVLVPNRSDKPGRRKSDDKPHPWQAVAPRWLLILAITGLVFAVGWQAAQLDGAERIAAALADANFKAQARLAERVAVNEEQQRSTNANVERLIVRMDKRDEAISELTTQLRLLTAQLKRSN